MNFGWRRRTHLQAGVHGQMLLARHQVEQRVHLRRNMFCRISMRITRFFTSQHQSVVALCCLSSQHASNPCLCHFVRGTTAELDKNLACGQ